MWLVSNFELLGPLISLVIDTKNFCVPALRFKPFMVLTLFYLATAYIAALGKPSAWGNVFAQYQLPGSAKRGFAWIITVEATIYGILVHLMRTVLQRYKQRRCTPL